MSYDQYRYSGGHKDQNEERTGLKIVQELCSFNPTHNSSAFRLPHDCYMIFVGRLTNREHLDKLTKLVHKRNDSYAAEDSTADFTMMETEEMEYFLEHVTLNNKAATNVLHDERRHHFVYEDHFNPALFDMVKREASFEKLKDVCRRYESKRGANVNEIMTAHEKRTSKSTSYFTKRGLSMDDAQGTAFALSFYTGPKSESVNRDACLVARQSNGEDIRQTTKDEMNEAAVILFYLTKALSYIPYYWGYVTRACQLTEKELDFYKSGSLITWIQYSSSKKGTNVAKTFDFANRNTYFKIYSLTGRSIKEFSNYDDEDEVLFLPHSTFFVFDHETVCGHRHIIYMRQVELGLSKWSILWVDDNIFDEHWENKVHMESAASRALNLNVHVIPKSSTESALSFLRSPFGQRLKNKDTFRIVTDMRRDNEVPSYNAGARLIKKLRNLGFENSCLLFVSNQIKTEQALHEELDSMELASVQVTTSDVVLKKFINFDAHLQESTSDQNSSASGFTYNEEGNENYF